MTRDEKRIRKAEFKAASAAVLAKQKEEGKLPPPIPLWFFLLAGLAVILLSAALIYMHRQELNGLLQWLGVMAGK